MSTLLILNATLIEDNRELKSDIYIRGGRIEKIARDLTSMKVSQILDLKGKYLLPGMIDSHVQFPDGSRLNECDGSGLDQGKGDFLTESKAAVTGGITTFFCASSTNVDYTKITSKKALDDKMVLASEKSLTNFSFYINATRDNLEQIKYLEPNSSCGIKISMGGTRGELLLDDEKLLNNVFKDAPLILVCHCEDTPTIVENEESYRQIHGDNIPIILHTKIRSVESCVLSSSLAIKLAKKHQTKLHILHLSTAKETEFLEKKTDDEKFITAGVAAHYLDFTEDSYAEKGALIKCKPAIKTEVDRAGLFQGLMEGRIDCICSNHSVSTLDQKQGKYFEVASGIANSQYALLTLLEHCHDGILTIQNVVDKTSHSVADTFQIKERGFIKEGYWADFVVVDFNKGIAVKTKDVVSKSGWTPYEGSKFRSSICATIVNGNIVYINNKVRSGTYGKQVQFNR